MARRIDKRPWMPDPFQDWLNGAVFARLDAADRGGLQDLARHAWQADGCTLPVDDDDLMARWSGLPDWTERKVRIMPALEWYLAFLREEKSAYREIIEKRQAAGKASAKVRQTNTCSTHAEHELNLDRPTVPSNRPVKHVQPVQPVPEDGASALGPRTGRDGSSNRPRVTTHDLTDDQAFSELYDKAILLGWITSSGNDREGFYAAAACAIRRAKASAKPANPGDVFMFVVHGKNWKYITDKDFEAGHARLLKSRGDTP